MNGFTVSHHTQRVNRILMLAPWTDDKNTDKTWYEVEKVTSTRMRNHTAAHANEYGVRVRTAGLAHGCIGRKH